LEHRASNPVSVKNLTAIETSTIVKLLRPYVPVGTKRTRRRRRRRKGHRGRQEVQSVRAKGKRGRTAIQDVEEKGDESRKTVSSLLVEKSEDTMVFSYTKYEIQHDCRTL
jgi:hypothetical protein